MPLRLQPVACHWPRPGRRPNVARAAWRRVHAKEAGMSITVRQALVMLLALVGWAASPGAGATGGSPPPGRLVDVGWLQQQLGQADLVVLDASPTPLHRKGHIPGAISADLYAVGPREVSMQRMQQRLQGWGLSPGQRIVIHDQGGSWLATRLFWDLLHQGVPADSLFILDGGLHRWQAAGGAVTTEATPVPPPGQIRITARRDDIRVRLPEFLAAGADLQRHALVDALEPDYYFGGAAFFDRAGHVPGAKLMPSSDFFNADKTFKSAAEIQRMADHLGLGRDQQIHTHCGGGGAATVPFFALKFLLGYPRVTLFLESQMGWLQDDRQLPFWTYAEPRLLRDTPWLKAWSSPMLRGFGLSAVTVVDLRPPEDFRAGHLPQSVNLPASSLRALQHAPDALAALLRQAGLDPSHEAVLVSEGGLNRDSALALWLLERAGQRRVSLYLGHVDRWAELGLDVVRPTPAAAAAGQATPAQARGTGLTVAVPGGAARGGHFPVVHIASGDRLPTRVPAGRMLHLPHAGLVQADGVPRPAADIWARLDKAGVPRLAQLVLVADDPADAAMNYVVLRLMGFADVTVADPSGG
jgi:thiosulfate/3-mercaptopyruvate sulfurtransferase